jgi:hypothetical protein
VALAQVDVGPFEGAAHSAVQKIVAAMSGPNVIAARDLAGRVRLLEPGAAPETVPVPSVIEHAIVARCGLGSGIFRDTGCSPAPFAGAGSGSRPELVRVRLGSPACLRFTSRGSAGPQVRQCSCTVP